MAVWKIGSRWGNRGPSVLDLFFNYECVFIGNPKDQNIGHWEEVQANDLFIIADGATPVALGKSRGGFQECDPKTFLLTPNDCQRLDADRLIACPMSIILLPMEDRQNDQWHIDPRRRFCRYHKNELDKEEYVQSEWRRLYPVQSKELQILPRTVSLFFVENCIFSRNTYYRVPKFQRPYSWNESQLRKILENLRDAVSSGNASFFGTMQLSQPMPLSIKGNLRAYNIIDGQQRLTTFILLKNLVEKRLGQRVTDYSASFITWVNKGEEQKKLNLYNSFLKNQDSVSNTDDNLYIKNYHLLDTLLDEYFNAEDGSPTIHRPPTIRDLGKYLVSDKVKIVVIETHAGLSQTLQIFNTINTTGLDLGAEDLFKIRLYEYRKQCGDGEQIFDDISEIYAQIEAYNAIPDIQNFISMSDVLRSYQRILIVRNNLNSTTFSMSSENFFEQLFDTLLGTRIWDDFRELENARDILSIQDLQNLVNCYKENFNLCTTNSDFRIIRQMIWETRYGYIWDMPIIARFFEKISDSEIYTFTLKLLKTLCPPSLYYGKTVHAMRATLFDLLKQLPGDGNWNQDFRIANQKEYDGISYVEMLNRAFMYQIAWYPKWKNLICRLVEYLKSQNRDAELYSRLWGDVDIEHIQCYTDEDNCEQVRQEWGDELNRLGNLAILESSLNRSIRNRKAHKKEAYSQSVFVSIRELQDRVNPWTKQNAEKRREENSRLLEGFILN